MRLRLALVVALTLVASAPRAQDAASPAPAAAAPGGTGAPATPPAPASPVATGDAAPQPGGSAATAAGALGISPADAAAPAGDDRPGIEALGITDPSTVPADPPAVAADARRLTVAVLADAPPFSAAGRFGVRTGFDVGIAQALCEALEARCTLLPLDPDAMIAALAERRADLALAAIELGDRREGNVILSAPYVRLAVRGIEPAAARKRDSDALDVVGVLADTAQANFAANASPPLGALLPYSDNEDMWLDLALGRLDVVLAPAVTAQGEFLGTPLGRGFRFRPQGAAEAEAPSRPAAVAMRSGDGELRAAVDRAIAAVVASPEYGDLLERYLGGLASPPSPAGG